MFIPYGKDYYVTASGSVVKVVNCESCGEQYLYDMKREAEGSGTRRQEGRISTRPIVHKTDFDRFNRLGNRRSLLTYRPRSAYLLHTLRTVPSRP